MGSITLPLDDSGPAAPGNRPGVQRIPHPEFVLRRGPYSGRPDVCSVDVLRGCVHRCPFCQSRAAGDFGDERAVYLFEGLAERLAIELAARKDRPRIVLVSPSTDPFQSLPELQAETLKIVRVLRRFGVVSWLATRGSIEPAILDELAVLQDSVRVTIGFTTLSSDLQKALEPAASPAAERLHLVTELKALKIPVDVNIEPLLPNLTDTRDSLQAMLESLADREVTHVSTGYLVLRPGVQEQMERELAGHSWLETVLSAYDCGPMLRDGQQLSRFLPKSRRQRGYATLMSLAANLGIEVRLNGLTNPDFHSPPNVAAAPHHVQSLRQAFRDSLRGPASADLFAD
jgi:DNA repair photolyase